MLSAPSVTSMDIDFPNRDESDGLLVERASVLSLHNDFEPRRDEDIHFPNRDESDKLFAERVSVYQRTGMWHPGDEDDASVATQVFSEHFGSAGAVVDGSIYERDESRRASTVDSDDEPPRDEWRCSSSIPSDEDDNYCITDLTQNIEVTALSVREVECDEDGSGHSRSSSPLHVKARSVTTMSSCLSERDDGF